MLRKISLGLLPGSRVRHEVARVLPTSTASLSRLLRRASVAGALTLLIGGCGDDSTQPPPPPTVASIVVTPTAATIDSGQTVQLSDTVKDAAGNVLTDRVVTWSSSDANIASVSSSGLVTGVHPGDATITATSEGQSATAQITVIAVPVGPVVVYPANINVAVGATFHLSVVDSVGTVIRGQTINWTSSDPAVASVGALSGVLTGVAPGTVTITGVVRGLTATGTITVVPGQLQLQQYVTGLDQPTELASPPGDTHRQFVLERAGRVRIIRDGVLLPTPFIDITGQVRTTGDQGLLSLAFHPQYGNGTGHDFIYIFYQDSAQLPNHQHVERWTASATNPDVADPASRKSILTATAYDDIFDGGQLLFAPDGKLYIGLGHSGRIAYSQDPRTILGKILRIDVDAGDPYAIPPDNPQVGGALCGQVGDFQATNCAEVWGSGMRQAYRITIDPGSAPTPLMYTADVGTTIREEVDAVPYNQASINYGYAIFEGTVCTSYGVQNGLCGTAGLTPPVFEYITHANASCAILGGYVYRGTVLTGVQGQYFYSDYCAGWVASFTYNGTPNPTPTIWGGGAGLIEGLGRDASGELYWLGMNGIVYKLVPR
jgi:glucose/arabinose dehydrogenase